MTTLSPQPPSSTLRNVIQLLLITLLCLLCYLVWRVAAAVAQIEHSVAVISSEVEHVAATAGKAAEQIDGLLARTQHLETMLSKAPSYKEIEVLARELMHGEDAVQPLEQGGVLPRLTDEIAFLLQTIGDSGLRYEYGGKQRGASWVHVKLFGVYQLKQSEIVNGEQFIANIARSTMAGDIYYVINKEGVKEPLEAFLTKALESYRSTKAAESAVAKPGDGNAAKGDSLAR
ncbi:MAG: DUF5329 family protein [Candidatus Hydrogenedentes bacterium]|nr:DUF5329 family protein [Candidatus Hydrogenedentota bacterium]